ncbi:MAG: beta-phosphoglucomutase [Flavobacteriales bacterium CG_4_9_14_0_2_um_filter_35_242]|nr:beta-phosphoglucomutase [Zetaproteobacteria bacterium]NDK17898.1 beta-phosphoglucomutase [Flavobacteriales bacterium]OIO10032.1 MAG: beta-phosphoglucomutase [Flavobacteriaceae bacterium CG1_02_35_72]PIR12318.1 MAG: beta-phosphoglucomutase [Flavobacteriales bacterium CG11_big_fil_rev_8_21_14_0_20_35_7]PIV16116.1 MAG: beta-phosphoglucomutase [Flavobacteriales bacterium CG03_land_8_20_14_0_80_35_15]PIX07416.1 MAG: beta-phosphoglucomutase [Flavobacteriales bacterium CG_4_8_14_3_um_filter_35_10]
MIKAVIFDLDGVVVDTAKFHFVAWNDIAKQFGFEISSHQNEQLKGVSRIKSLDLILEWGHIKLSQEQKTLLLNQKNEAYLAAINLLNKTDILPGILEILTYLKSKNIPVALGSASKNALPILQKLGISTLFNVIVDGNIVQKAKPDPEVFMQAANKLHVLPKHCLVIEDAKAGIDAANNAKMTSIGIGNKEILINASYVLEDTSKLSKKFIDELLKN